MKSANTNVAPRVSVIIATYNWATVLPYSIGSVLDQTFTDFELLVVGDGCTDESADVVASFQDPRVHWVNLPRNTGHQAGPRSICRSCRCTSRRRSRAGSARGASIVVQRTVCSW